MTHNIRNTSINLLATSECNLLLSLQALHPDDVYRQVLPELNHIGWIFGHCAVHLDWVFSLTTGQEPVLSEKVHHYYRYGTTKSEILESSPPISFNKLVDGYLVASESFFKFLKELEEEDLHRDFSGESGENLMQTIVRVSLHFMGHSGQIVLLRQALGNPGPSFVSGVAEQTREKLLAGWHEWWKQGKEKFM